MMLQFGRIIVEAHAIHWEYYRKNNVTDPFSPMYSLKWKTFYTYPENYKQDETSLSL